MEAQVEDGMETVIYPYISVVAGLLLAPALPSIINRTKAVAAGRKGPPLTQTYRDLARLLRKGVVYSNSTSLIFRLAPVVTLACVMLAMALLPVSANGALVAFTGDMILFVYLFGLMRFFTVACALDTGSSFEGMGASREVLFSALVEPALLVSLVTLARVGGSLSLSGIYQGLTSNAWLQSGPTMVLILVTLFMVCLSENSRIPFDDPDTHLELTMIHEVMILDNSGPDLAFILYGSCLKLWVLGGLMVNIILPATGLSGLLALGVFILAMAILAVLVGIVESVMARLGLLKVPRILLGAGVLSLLAFTLVFGFV